MLTTNEAAAALNLTRRRVLALIEAGRLKAQKYGRDWIVTQAELDRYTHDRRGPGRPKERTIV